jgi:hypothetical protein
MFDPKLFSNSTIFTDEQLKHLSMLHHINQIDANLRVVASINFARTGNDTPPRVILVLVIYYQSKKVDTLTFDINNYEYKEIIDLVKNVRGSEFLLQEIDNFLAGDVGE